MIELDDLRTVRYDVARRIATITLNRPDRLNAWTGRMHAEYRQCLTWAEADRTVRVIVVTGAGRGFCAGADTAALEGHVAKGGYDDGLREEPATPGFGVRDEFDHDFAYHFGVAKPIIAAINGPAAGVGLVLACFCDLRFAAAGAKLTTSAPRLGLPAEFGLSWVLPRIVGLGHANDLLLSSRVILAEEAATMGLVNRVFPAEHLIDETYAYARMLAEEISPSSLATAKHQIYADQHDDVGTSVERAKASLEQMMREPDYAEGVRAWMAKQTPSFDDPNVGTEVLSRRAAESRMTVPEYLRREVERLAARPTVTEWLERTRRRPGEPSRADTLEALDELRGPWPT